MAYLDNVYAVVQIAPTGIPTYVRLSQNENGRVLNFAVSGDALPAGSTVALTGTKPDGAVYSASGTLADNVATFNEDEQLTAVAGEWDAKVEFTNSGNLIATGRIKFVIDADPSGGNIPSDSQLDGYIAEMLSMLDAGKAEAYGSPLVASTVAGMIDQSRVYVYTGSETGYTAGNWYYWNGSAWTSGGVYNSVAINTDTTLSVAGMAADAKATGDALNGLDTRLDAAEEDITAIKDDLSHIEPGLSDDAKVALLACFNSVTWEDGDGQDYISALRQALYPNEYPQIQASISLGTHTVFYDDDVNTLKPYLTVTYYETESSSGVTVPSTDYTLSGSLDSAINTVTVTYNGLHTTVSVNALMPVFAYDSSSGKLLSEMEGVDIFDSTVTASETLSDGHLLLSASAVSNPNNPTYKQYRIIPNTFSNGMMRVKFNLLAISNVDNVYNGMRLRISSGNSGVTIGQAPKSSGISINYAEGSTVKSAGIIQLNEWHVLELYMSGSSQTISLDGTPLVSSKPLSTVGATNNSLFIQNGSSSGAVSFYVDKLQLFEIV